LHFGRKSGYGCYGPPPDIVRGGTVITIKNKKNVNLNFNIKIN
jgi:hypothetical protein